MDFTKYTTEGEVLAFLQNDQLRFPPLRVTDIQVKPRFSAEGGLLVPDACFNLRWGEKIYPFAVEIKGLWTPKVIAMAAEQARRYAAVAGIYPLIVVPYLDDKWLLMLEAQGVSGIDLCGNGVVIVPGEVLVLRTGLPNRFRSGGAIKNVYRKNSSIVARVFLLAPQFPSVKAALEEIRRRGGKVTAATVSKVCKSMEDDLVLERGRGETPVARQLRLLQADKLLDLLANNYVPPEVRGTFRGKCGLQPETLRQQLAQGEANGGPGVVLTGASSVDAYAVMAREPVQSFYCTDLNKVVGSLGSDVRETDRFANVLFQQTHDDFVYFDRRPGLVASPIQTYLELIKGDKRDKETADQVRRLILEKRSPATRREE